MSKRAKAQEVFLQGIDPGTPKCTTQDQCFSAFIRHPCFGFLSLREGLRRNSDGVFFGAGTWATGVGKMATTKNIKPAVPQDLILAVVIYPLTLGLGPLQMTNM